MTNKMAGKLITLNTASARNQWYSKDSVFWLAQVSLYVMVMRFCWASDVISLQVCWYVNLRIYNLFFWLLDMTFGLTKSEKLCNVITHNVIWAKKTKYFVYRWLCPYVMLDVMCFPAFVRASNIISSIILIRLLLMLKCFQKDVYLE